MKLPFSIDRSNRIKLAYQVADGLREAIQNGKWKPGERLPSSREIKAALGTSVRAPAEALRMLAEEGLITLREKCGAVVNERNMPQVKGRVLIIVPGGSQVRSVSVFMEYVRREFNAAGYVVVTTSVLRDEGSVFVDGDPSPYNLRQLEIDLRMTYSLVIVCGGPPSTNGITHLLAMSGFPFLVVLGPADDAPNCIGGIHAGWSEATAKLVAHIRGAGIRKTLLVRKWERDGRDFLAAMREAGMRIGILTVPQKTRRGRSEDLWAESFALFERQFDARGKAWLPELVYFTDDHCFLGAAFSLLKRGVRVPDDVRIVTNTNAGMRPPFAIPLSCLEMEVKANAALVAKAAIDWLERGRSIPADMAIKCNYVPGDTFPLVAGRVLAGRRARSAAREKSFLEPTLKGEMKR